jgi:hypothetical protein
VTKLNAIIAVEKTAKSEGEKALTHAYQEVQKTPLLTGISRTYQPRDEEGDTLPPENERVQRNVEEILDGVGKGLTRLFDVTLTKEASNTKATADVVVDGETLLSDVPVTYLLFLEKKLTDLKTFVTKLPVLDPSTNWHADASLEEGVWVSDEVKTTRTKKVPRNHVLAAATDKHPAQVQVYHEDVIVGDWTTKKFSGAVPAARRAALIERVNKLSDAVKVARETANGIEVTDRKAGEAVFEYLFS